MKTLDETKKGLECCSGAGHCFGECPYYTGNPTIECIRHKSADALSYIQQLEAANAELLTKVEQLEAKCHQLERERDAAVADLEHVKDCDSCKYDNECITGKKDCFSCHEKSCPCMTCKYEWRGVKEG